jgi:hypothetical protein
MSTDTNGNKYVIGIPFKLLIVVPVLIYFPTMFCYNLDCRPMTLNEKVHKHKLTA